MFRSNFWSARYWLARFFGADEDTSGVYVPPARRRQPKGATVTLRGVEFRADAGALGLAVGVTSTLTGVALSASHGHLDAEGIQNPTAEEMALLLSLDAVTGG